jgi:DNA-directed RNA polymerase specialized sigma24 family protein
MTCEQAAGELGIRPTAVRMLLSRARRRLQQLLASYCGAAKDHDLGPT